MTETISSKVCSGLLSIRRPPRPRISTIVSALALIKKGGAAALTGLAAVMRSPPVTVTSNAGDSGASHGLVIGVNLVNGSASGELRAGADEAIIEFDITNRNGSKVFILNFPVENETGRVLNTTSETVNIASKRSQSWRIDVPLASKGTYTFYMEAMSARDRKILGSTQITVKVP